VDVVFADGRKTRGGRILDRLVRSIEYIQMILMPVTVNKTTPKQVTPGFLFLMLFDRLFPATDKLDPRCLI
jgi:hypothetical protein